MSGPSQGEREPLSPFIIILLALLSVGVVTWFWNTFGTAITDAALRLRSAELWVVGLFTDRYDALARFVREADPASLPLEYLVEASRDVGRALRWIAIPALVAMATALLVKNRFRRRFTIETLIREHARIRPILLPILAENPLKRPYSDKWQPMQTPREWAEARKIDVADEHSVINAFAEQLTVSWTGPENLPPHMRALLAVFLLHYTRRRDAARALAGRLCRVWAGDVLDSRLMARLQRLLRKDKAGRHIGMDRALLADGELWRLVSHLTSAAARKDKDAQRFFAICDRHAYVETALASAYQACVEAAGILPSSYFLWLRRENRPLWYVLNAVGSNTAPPEAAGAIAHWKVEKGLGRPERRVCVQEAARAFFYAISENREIAGG